MAFHFSLLGPVSAQLQQYSDGNGFVPELNDLWQDFHWCHRLQRQFSDPESGDTRWRAFVSYATNTTLLAFQKLRAMEWSDISHGRVGSFRT